MLIELQNKNGPHSLFDCVTNYRETNPASGRGEALKPAPPDYNTSALNHSGSHAASLTSSHSLHKVI